jgi:predicted transcriptional regulator
VAALLSGTAHTSGELAKVCSVAPSTMSGHLGKLVDAGILSVESAGRHRAYRISSRQVADLIEQMDAILLPETEAPKRPSPGSGLAYARSCYDHVAGQLGIELHDVFLDRAWVAVEDERPVLTASGADFLDEFGIDVDALRAKRRPMLRFDLDWTERRHHLAGSAAAALMDELFAKKWIRRRQDKRQLLVTERGRVGLAETFGITP